MNLEKYQIFAVDISSKYEVWAGKEFTIPVIALGLGGELGELAESMELHNIEHRNLESICLEMGDILCYLTILLDYYKLSLQEVYIEALNHSHYNHIEYIKAEDHSLSLLSSLMKYSSKLTEAIKKYYRDGKDIERLYFKQYSIRVLDCLLNLMYYWDITLEQVIESNKAKLIKRSEDNSLQK